MAKLPWKAWHEVVTLREDLKKGELALHLFAADLYEVVMQNGKRPVYEDPVSFFALTFPTHNLRSLVRDVALRLAGKNDKAVRQLELTYGGGKTHTLITLRQLVHAPDKLPDLPAVGEFEQAIGQPPPPSRVAALCFDKLDVESGMDVRSPEGGVRRLKQPWSVLAYQIAGDAGLKLLNADGKAEERDSAPAENLLTELLEVPVKQNLGVLVLLDEVLIYATEKVAHDDKWRHKLKNFFQYLTQAAAKVDRCCIVASLLASDPDKNDSFGRKLLGELYDIFQRQREEAVEPVVKEDVAEVLRRRFFTSDSIKDREAFRQHVIAALKGIQAIDEQTAKQGPDAEDRFLKSYPFHPDLTEVFYGNWTSLDRFQRTRGVLRTFALGLREAAKWDTSPLIGPSVFLNAPGREELSEAARELVTVADTEEHEGKKQAWTGILVGELGRARQIQKESVGLRSREIEQAVLATFLHSQPIGHEADTRDLLLLVGPVRPDKIELEKGLNRWARGSHWLDDENLPDKDDRPPSKWRLGNRPNLNQMHAAAMNRFSDEVVRARLLDEILKVKALTNGASQSGVRVHTLPAKPKDIEDDGLFHYAVLAPSASSESGKPSPEARRFLDEKSGPDKPRVNRNAVLLLTPSKDGLALAEARVREYLGWEQTRSDLTPKNKEEEQQKGTVDVGRMQTLMLNIDKARGRVPEAIRQAYCVVVTISDKNEDHAFKIVVTDDPHFTTIKNDDRSRVKETAITAEALLPDGPYNLWQSGETSRRVKDLAGAFAERPHLPKMLKAQAIVETLVSGCEAGTFALRLPRPDKTFRTWWRGRPDDAALADPAMELVLPEAAELSSLSPDLMAPKILPGLWTGDTVTVQAILSYFDGGKVVQVDKGTHQEPLVIPKASPDVVIKAIGDAVAAGLLWARSGPASMLDEPVPAGILTPNAILKVPPSDASPVSILPENLPAAWTDGVATAASIADALSAAAGETLPWKTIREAVSAAAAARFIELVPGSESWPSELATAASVKVRVPAAVPSSGDGGGGGKVPLIAPNVRAASRDFDPAQMQDLVEALPELLKISAKTGTPIRFHVRLELGNLKTIPSSGTIAEVNAVLKSLGEGFKVS